MELVRKTAGRVMGFVLDVKQKTAQILQKCQISLSAVGWLWWNEIDKVVTELYLKRRATNHSGGCNYNYVLSLVVVVFSLFVLLHD